MTSDELNAYNKGYHAGRKRKAKDISVEARKRREDALWHRYMAAAVEACVNSVGWKVGDKPIIDVVSRTSLAADFADAAMREARIRGRGA